MGTSDLAEGCTMLADYSSARVGLCILDTQLTKSALNELGKKATHRLDMPRPSVNRSGLSIRSSCVLFKQLIYPMMDCTSHI